MKRLYPTPPYYEVTPYTIDPQYFTYTSLGDIFTYIRMCVQTGNNTLCLADSPSDMLSRLHDIQTLTKEQIIDKYKLAPPTRAPSWSLDTIIKELKDVPTQDLLPHIHPIMKQALFTGYTFYNPKTSFILTTSARVFSSVLKIPNNPVLVYSRITKNPTQAHSPFLVTSLVTHTCLSQGQEAYCSPLFLDSPVLGTPNITPNLSPSFLKKVKSQYPDNPPDPLTILGYIYAILWHTGYRRTYCQALRLDYPRIPLVKTTQTFYSLANLGKCLMTLHIQYPRHPIPS